MVASEVPMNGVRLFARSSARGVLLTVAIAALAACSTTSSPLATVTKQANQTRIHANTASCPSAVAYIVDNYTASVQVYDRANLKAGPCGTIGGFQLPQGLFADSKGHLWVADATAQQIYEFAPGNAAPVQTLNDPYGVPV